MRSKKPRLSSIAPISLSPRSTPGLGPRRPSSSPLDAALGAFRSECDLAVEELKHSLRTLCRSASCDPLRPQEVSRAFGINKNLTWKFARVLLATDSFEAIPMIPGPEGVEIYLRAFEAAGIARSQTDTVREALRRFDAVVARHFGDRSQLEVVLDGLRSDSNLESSRRTAFRGMAGVFGVKARVRLTTHIVSPTPSTEGKADISLIVGLAGIQRLRPIGTLPLFRTLGRGSRPPTAPEPLLGPAGSDEFMLREFSNFPAATVTATEEGGRLVVELSEGPLGRMGESDLFFGSVVRGEMNTRAQPDDSIHNLITLISIPSEAFVSDLFLHRSLLGIDEIQTSIHSTISQPLSLDERHLRSTALPIDVTPERIEEVTAGFGVAGVPRYEEMMGQAFARLGQSASEYLLLRVAMSHPPAPAALLQRWPLKP